MRGEWHPEQVAPLALVDERWAQEWRAARAAALANGCPDPDRSADRYMQGRALRVNRER